MLSPFDVQESCDEPVGQQPFEIVERKGRGHPDSICDALAEQVSLSLCREYLAKFHRVLHHNVDKALLVAGQTAPRPGGGTVLEPMRLVLGDRATSRCDGQIVDVAGIAESSARTWLRRNLRFVDPDSHLAFQSELKEGSPELTDIFARGVIGANDTSAAVGYAPLSETEQLVLAAENWLVSPEVHALFPEAGEDVKVMAVRRNRELQLTVAIAFVDRFVPSAIRYFERKEELRQALVRHLTGKLDQLDRLSVQLNTLDEPARGDRGIYLTVLGTSAEGGDCGQVGRGNRVNGVIPLNRPISNEAAAGKNPVSHVGKIYSLLTHHIAQQLVEQIPEIAESYVWLCSQIGKPIDQPLMASVRVRMRNGIAIPEVKPRVQEIFERQLAGISQFTQRLIAGEFPVC